MKSRHSQAGATLIELIVSIVILSVAAVGIMMVITNTTASSANPMIRAQGTAILQAYMEEILSKPLTDPAGADTGGREPGETNNRALFDDVTDYFDVNDDGARDQNGNPISGLEGYDVSVTVTDTTLNGSNAKRILVTVTYKGDAGFSLPVAAYRLN